MQKDTSFWHTCRSNTTIKKSMRTNTKFKIAVTFRGGRVMQLEQDSLWSFNVCLLRLVVSVHYKVSVLFDRSEKAIIKEKSSEF